MDLLAAQNMFFFARLIKPFDAKRFRQREREAMK